MEQVVVVVMMMMISIATYDLWTVFLGSNASAWFDLQIRVCGRMHSRGRCVRSSAGVRRESEPNSAVASSSYKYAR